ncbi:MAG: cupin domain-containing protein [Desulfobacterales bacterium]
MKSEPVTISPAGESFDFGGLSVHWKIDGPASNGRFAVVHHPLAPHALAAPLHCHQNEDEYSYVITGTLGAILGDDVVTAEAGSWVVKPRKQWHTFWNAGDTPCEIIEIISPRLDLKTIFARWPPPGATWNVSGRSMPSISLK